MTADPDDNWNELEWHFVVTFDSAEMVQLTLSRRTLASSPKSTCISCHQQGHADSKTSSSKSSSS